MSRMITVIILLLFYFAKFESNHTRCVVRLVLYHADNFARWSLRVKYTLFVRTQNMRIQFNCHDRTYHGRPICSNIGLELCHVDYEHFIGPPLKRTVHSLTRGYTTRDQLLHFLGGGRPFIVPQQKDRLQMYRSM